ncbi:BrnA antitoxin family protein [Fangia hongkongensis]|uniref:BrnA antitoxin family protein n=1 Tax=Fangia hongkongensis TaxID=270495 RepID=UPI00035C5C9A|nr:BrnA antitoxin family protein [Fangia hongkongensis]MBK2124968.1 BrnA antitoxin family protein [Fangia hongkongensis]
MKEKKLDIKQQLEAVKNMKDSEIDYSDSSDMGDADWAKFKPFTNTKKSVTIRLDSDIIEYFKSMGKGYQTKINAVLREYKRHH